MIYLVHWTVTPANRDAAQNRFKETGGPPPEGVQMLGRWHHADGGGGMCVARSDDPVAIAKWVQAWSDLMTFRLEPALDDEGFAGMLG